MVKVYRPDEEGFRLAGVEYQALEHYARMVAAIPDMVACCPLKIVQEQDLNAIVFEYFSGYSLGRFFYRSLWSKEYGRKLLQVVERLCFYLQVNLELCQNQNEVSDGLSGFFAEYMLYCSNGLEKHFSGRFLCSGFVREAEELCREFAAQPMGKSGLCRIHGDLVPANILVNSKGEFCLIDFANSQPNGHLLSDVYGFLCSIRLFSLCPSVYKPVRALFDGLIQKGGYSELERKFFYEFHRRRWLWLKISSLHPLRQLEFWRALWTPFDAG
jgi:serine/threonine protein kinase